MRKRDRKLLARYIREVADHMELRDWCFDLKADPTEPGCYATIWPVFGQRLATIRICENFRTLDPVTQRGVVVHELIHCHLAPLQSQLDSDLDDILGGQANALFWRSVLRNLEFAVDALEKCIAPQMPLIGWDGP